MYFFIPKTNFMGKWQKFIFSNEICEECATTCWAKSEIDFYKLPAWEGKVKEQRQIQFWNLCPKCQIENTTEWFYTSEEWIFCVETLFLLTVEGNLSQPAVSENWRFYLQLASTWCSTNKVIVFKTYPTPRIDLSVRVWLFTTSTTYCIWCVSVCVRCSPIQRTCSSDGCGMDGSHRGMRSRGPTSAFSKTNVIKIFSVS